MDHSQIKYNRDKRMKWHRERVCKKNQKIGKKQDVLLFNKYLRRIIVDEHRNGIKNGRLHLVQSDIDDELVPDLCRWIRVSKHVLKRIDLSNNQISSRSSYQLFRTLSICPGITTIDLKGNLFDDGVMEMIGKFLHSNYTVEYVDIGSRITDDGVRIIAPYLHGNDRIKYLNFSFNRGITNNAIIYLNDIASNSVIENIFVYETSITLRNALAIPLAVNKLKGCSDKFSLPFIDATDDDVFQISRSMKQIGLGYMRELCMHGNLITSKGAIALFETLKYAPQLSLLNLSRNNIGDESMDTLGELLQECKSIKTLFLDRNSITDEGVETLAGYLYGNISLASLDFSLNSGISNRSIPFFIEISTRTRLRKINTSQTAIQWQEEGKLRKSLELPDDEREIPIISKTKSAAKSKYIEKQQDHEKFHIRIT